MIPLLVLLLIFAVLGAGFVASWLWFILVIAMALWVIGFFIGGAARTVESFNADADTDSGMAAEPRAPLISGRIVDRTAVRDAYTS